jgi:hypothetical protein
VPHVNKADSSVANRSVPFGEFVANICDLEHRALAILLKRSFKTATNSILALHEFLPTLVAFSRPNFLFLLVSLSFAPTISYLLFTILFFHSKSLSLFIAG